jgi:hypothetical protein
MKRLRVAVAAAAAAATGLRVCIVSCWAISGGYWAEVGRGGATLNWASVCWIIGLLLFDRCSVRFTIETKTDH